MIAKMFTPSGLMPAVVENIVRALIASVDDQELLHGMIASICLRNRAMIRKSSVSRLLRQVNR